MIQLLHNGDHMDLLVECLVYTGYKEDWLQSQGIYNRSLIRLSTDEQYNAWKEVVLSNSDFLVKLLKQHSTIKAPLYFLQCLVRNHNYRETCKPDYDVKKTVSEDWERTKEELKGEEFFIIAE